jgi:DNA ligase-1
MRTLQRFNEFIKEITSSNSRLHKQAVLQKHKDSETIQRYLQIAFDPYKVFGISNKKLHKEVNVSDLWPEWCTPTMYNLFDYLETHNSGRDYDIAVCQLALNEVAALDRECAELLEKLICKDLSIGCDSKTINKEIPGCIPEFNVQLANKYFDKPQIVEGKKFAITTKIDGGRIIALKENGQVSFYTRAGQRYEGLVDLESEMLRLIPDNWCLDGEITLLSNPKALTSKDQYKETMKIVRTKDKNKHGIKMLVFDAMSAEDFKSQQCVMPYKRRRAVLEELFCLYDFRYFELLPLLYVGEDTSKITEILDEETANGEEGVMINIWDAPYEFKRTNHLLKCKKMQTMDLEIIGFEEGTGRLAKTLGAILVRYKNGNVVKVGSGFSDEMRNMIWDHRDECLGTICEIQYFEETTNADGGESLRFPIFKDFRHDKLEADF